MLFLGRLQGLPESPELGPVFSEPQQLLAGGSSWSLNTSGAANCDFCHAHTVQLNFPKTRDSWLLGFSRSPLLLLLFPMGFTGRGGVEPTPLMLQILNDAEVPINCREGFQLPGMCLERLILSFKGFCYKVILCTALWFFTANCRMTFSFASLMHLVNKY